MIVHIRGLLATTAVGETLVRLDCRCAARDEPFNFTLIFESAAECRASTASLVLALQGEVCKRFGLGVVGEVAQLWIEDFLEDAARLCDGKRVRGAWGEWTRFRLAEEFA